jgi:hypothetical protein
MNTNANQGIIVTHDGLTFTKLVERYQIETVFESLADFKIPVFQAFVPLSLVKMELQLDPTIDDPVLGRRWHILDRYGDRPQQSSRLWQWLDGELVCSHSSRADVTKELKLLGVPTSQISEKLTSIKTSELVETLDQSEEQGQVDVTRSIKTSGTKMQFETGNKLMPLVRISTDRMNQRLYKLTGGVDLSELEIFTKATLKKMNVAIFPGYIE